MPLCQRGPVKLDIQFALQVKGFLHESVEIIWQHYNNMWHVQDAVHGRLPVHELGDAVPAVGRGVALLVQKADHVADAWVKLVVVHGSSPSYDPTITVQ